MVTWRRRVAVQGHDGVVAEVQHGGAAVAAVREEERLPLRRRRLLLLLRGLHFQLHVIQGQPCAPSIIILFSFL